VAAKPARPPAAPAANAAARLAAVAAKAAKSGVVRRWLRQLAKDGEIATSDMSSKNGRGGPG
jgi:hypothetical protein